jgi:hypothetical protein
VGGKEEGEEHLIMAATTLSLSERRKERRYLWILHAKQFTKVTNKSVLR